MKWGRKFRYGAEETAKELSFKFVDMHDGNNLAVEITIDETHIIIPATAALGFGRKLSEMGADSLCSTVNPEELS